jgi:hypothetical protein
MPRSITTCPGRTARRSTAPMLAAALLAATGIALPAHAQQLEPGLWEVTTRGGGMDAAMAQMQEQMAGMTPQQRQMMQQMMAGQGVAMGGRPNAVRVCIGPEQAARAEPPAEPGCRHEVLQRGEGVLKVRFACDGPPPSRGEGEYKIAGPRAYSGRMIVELQQDGAPQRMEMTQEARWIGADCGALQPRPAR